MVPYRPFSQRTPDTQYQTLLRLIKDRGEEVPTQQDASKLQWIGHTMRFDLANGFPIITERDLISEPSQFKMALAELCAFLNGAHTLEEMRSFGCGWWAPWVTEEKCRKRGLETGDLGPGSYGPAWRSFPTAEGGSFDQITHVLQQIRELPHLTTHIASPWIPQYLGRGENKQQKVVVVPCHGWFHVHVNAIKQELTLLHFQRSADAPVGLVFNLIQYAALTLMLAQVTGYRPKALVYLIDDAHIYLKQMPHVDAMLQTTPEAFPTVTFDPTVKDLFAFRPDHFTVTDYHPRLPRRRIWTPV